MTLRALPVARRSSNVCEICRNPSHGELRCPSCGQVTRALGLGTMFPFPRVFPLGFAVKKSELAIALWEYKRSDVTRDADRPKRDLQTFIDARLPHIMEHVGRADIYTFVPGRRSRSAPVRSLIESTTWADDVTLEQILTVAEYEIDTHTPDIGRFRAEPVLGKHVVVFDDTFTRGATALSAVRAVYEAGAIQITVVVVGRHGDRGWLGADYLHDVEHRLRRGEFCPECDATLPQESPWGGRVDCTPPARRHSDEQRATPRAVPDAIPTVSGNLPGDIKDGHVLGSDGQWRPLRPVLAPTAAGYWTRIKDRLWRSMMFAAVVTFGVLAVQSESMPGDARTGLIEWALGGVIGGIIFGLPLALVIALVPAKPR